MSDYFLIPDDTQVKEAAYRLKVCTAFAQLALAHPFKTATDRLIAQYWPHPEPPPTLPWFNRNLTINNLKWYINKFIKPSDPLWNGDFLRGITQAGQVIVSRKQFSSFHWYNNTVIEELLAACPYYGAKNDNFTLRNNKQEYVLKNMAALSLPYSEKALPFMAGVLATGQVAEINKDIYARYNVKVVPWLQKWKIPIEDTDKKGRAYVSPLWPALLTPWMPKLCEHWPKHKKAYKAEDYALIVWKVFTNKDIQTKGIPYLVSRRSYYYQYGSIKGLSKSWVDMKLVGMDSRFKEAAQYWEQHLKSSKRMYNKQADYWKEEQHEN